MMLYMADPGLRRARFEALFREHHSAVRAYARRRVPSEVVDDIVSETFLVVWRRLDDVPEAPLPWLLRSRDAVKPARRFVCAFCTALKADASFVVVTGFKVL